MQYYFLASLLPPLEIGHVPTLGFQEFRELMRINLTEEHWHQIGRFLRLIDLENMRALWLQEPLDPHGNANREKLEQAILEERWPDGEEFPAYMVDYLVRYSSVEERVAHFPLLLAQFFNEQLENQEGGQEQLHTDFFGKYFAFQREMRLVVLGFRAKKLDRDPVVELQYEDETDPLVAQILAQKDAKTYEPPFEYRELWPIFDAYVDKPRELHRALYEYQFDHLVELGSADPFSIERILNYLSRLILVERWMELTVQKGLDVINTIERNIA